MSRSDTDSHIESSEICKRKSRLFTSLDIHSSIPLRQRINPGPPPDLLPQMAKTVVFSHDKGPEPVAPSRRSRSRAWICGCPARIRLKSLAKSVLGGHPEIEHEFRGKGPLDPLPKRESWCSPRASVAYIRDSSYYRIR